MSEQLTQKQRETFVESSRQVAQEVLHIPEVQDRLGYHASNLYALTNQILQMPVENGLVHIDKYDPTHDTITTIALRMGEKAARVVSATPFDAHQYKTAVEHYGKDQAGALQQEYLSLRGPTSNLYMFSNELAYVHTDDVRTTDDKGIKAQPILALNYDRSNGSFTDAAVTLHELAHVRQTRELPVRNSREIAFANRDLSQELEGYYVSAMTILGIQDANRQREFLTSIPQESIDRALKVEEIRSAINKYELDPFAANKVIASELMKHNLGITPFLRSQQKR